MLANRTDNPKVQELGANRINYLSTNLRRNVKSSEAQNLLDLRLATLFCLLVVSYGRTTRIDLQWLYHFVLSLRRTSAQQYPVGTRTLTLGSATWLTTVGAPGSAPSACMDCRPCGTASIQAITWRSSPEDSSLSPLGRWANLPETV